MGIVTPSVPVALCSWNWVLTRCAPGDRCLLRSPRTLVRPAPPLHAQLVPLALHLLFCVVPGPGASRRMT